MSQVKIYALSETLAQHQAALSDAIHNALMQTFKLPANKRFQRFIGLSADGFIYFDDAAANM